MLGVDFTLVDLSYRHHHSLQNMNTDRNDYQSSHVITWHHITWQLMHDITCMIKHHAHSCTRHIQFKSWHHTHIYDAHNHEQLNEAFLLRPGDWLIFKLPRLKNDKNSRKLVKLAPSKISIETRLKHFSFNLSEKDSNGKDGNGRS